MLSTLSIVALAAAAAAFFDPFTAGDDPCPHSTCPNCPKKEYDQCGGQGWTGPTCCLPYDKCTVINPYYSQCQPTDFCKTPDFGQCNGTDKGQPIPKDHQCCPPSFECNATDPPYYSQCIPSNVTSNCSQPYGQCGGKDWTGPTCCIPGYVCNKTSDYCAPPPPAQSPRATRPPPTEPRVLRRRLGLRPGAVLRQPAVRPVRRPGPERQAVHAGVLPAGLPLRVEIAVLLAVRAGRPAVRHRLRSLIEARSEIACV